MIDKFQKGGSTKKASAGQDKQFQAWLQKLGEEGLKKLQARFVEELQQNPQVAEQFQQASDEQKQQAFLAYAYQTYQQMTSGSSKKIDNGNGTSTVSGSQAYSPSSSNPTPFTQAADYRPKAKMGAKLAYIQSLNGRCPEGYEMVQAYSLGGGVKCGRCAKKRALMQNTMEAIKEACGGKAKKRISKKYEEGSQIPEIKCGKKMNKRC